MILVLQKDDAETEIVQVDEARQQLDLRPAVHFEIDLLHLRRVLRVGLDAHPLRVARVALDQVLDHAAASSPRKTGTAAPPART